MQEQNYHDFEIDKIGKEIIVNIFRRMMHEEFDKEKQAKESVGDSLSVKESVKVVNTKMGEKERHVDSSEIGA